MAGKFLKNLGELDIFVLLFPVDIGKSILKFH